MKFNFNAIRVIASFSLVIVLGSSPLNAQTTEVDAPFESVDQVEDEKPFSQVIDEVQSNERLINKLFSTIPIGFPDEQEAHMKRIDDLKKANVVLKSKLDDAALKAFQQDPAKHPLAGEIVFNRLTQKLDGSSADVDYDPDGALELADLMLKAEFNSNNVKYEQIAFQAFRASFAIQDFARANLMLKKIEERGIPLQPVWREYLAETQEKWQRELMIRRLEANADDLPRVKIETTEGDVVVELFENHAPQTVGNFISLVEKKFYDQLPFFLVQPGVSATTGCQHGNGTGNAGYQIPCECYGEEIRHHFTGTLSMANNGRDSGGSQFFITHQRNPIWDGKFTAFGRVIEGMDVVYKLRNADGTRVQGGEFSKIIKASIIRKRNHPYSPTRVANADNEKKTGALDLDPPLDSFQPFSTSQERQPGR